MRIRDKVNQKAYFVCLGFATGVDLSPMPKISGFFTLRLMTIVYGKKSGEEKKLFSLQVDNRKNAFCQSLHENRRFKAIQFG